MMNCFCGMIDQGKAHLLALFPTRTLSEILTNANLWHTASRIWTCAEPEFRLSWMKLCSSDNHYTTAPQVSVVRTRFSLRIFEIIKKALPFCSIGHNRMLIFLRCYFTLILFLYSQLYSSWLVWELDHC